MEMRRRRISNWMEVHIDITRATPRIQDLPYKGACAVGIMQKNTRRALLLHRHSPVHRAAAARRAISLRLCGVSAAERAFAPAKPPLRLAGCVSRVSSISPVAILATVTAQPTTSAGRRSPLGPLAMLSLAWRLSACPLLFVAHHRLSSILYGLHVATCVDR